MRYTLLTTLIVAIILVNPGQSFAGDPPTAPGTGTQTGEEAPGGSEQAPQGSTAPEAETGGEQPSNNSASPFNFKTPSSLNSSPFKTVNSAVGWMFKTAISLGSIAFVILFLVAGVQYLAGAGSEDNTKKAGKLMLNAVIGLFLILTSWAVGTYVLGLLGLSIS